MPVITEVADSIATITLADPDRRNALGVEMMQELTTQLRAVGEREDVAVVVVAAQGPVFSAGHDLREMIGQDLEREREIFAVCVEMMNTVQGIRQPVIAKVQGVAVAAGLQLVASCDLAVAADNAMFGTPGVKIGLFCSTPMVALSRNIGRKRAMQMLLTGQVINSATAVEWGLINDAVPADQLDAEVNELATQIAAASPLTLSIGKQAFYKQIDLPQDAAYEAMAETMATNAVTCDAQEGMTAFVEKRTPHWQGK